MSDLPSTLCRRDFPMPDAKRLSSVAQMLIGWRTIKVSVLLASGPMAWPKVHNIRC